MEERRRGDGGIGRDATFSWSRALIHPTRCNRMCHRVNKVERFQGPCHKLDGEHLGFDALI